MPPLGFPQHFALELLALVISHQIPVASSGEISPTELPNTTNAMAWFGRKPFRWNFQRFDTNMMCWRNGWYKNDEEMKRNTFFRMAVGRKPKASRILVRIEWIVDDKLS